MLATGRYASFVPAFIESAREHVSDLHRVFALGEDPDVGRVSPLIEWLPWGHLPWPYPTLLRYHAITAHRGRLEAVDHLVYMDVDMRIEQRCDFSQVDGLFAVEHPGFVGADPGDLPYERRAASKTYCSPTESSQYFCGGVQGGTSRAYLDACLQMSRWIDADLANGLVPVWHDESAWNRWCSEHSPELILPHTYCWPETKVGATPIIVALDKNHGYFRATSTWQAAVARVRPHVALVRRFVERSARRVLRRLSISLTRRRT